jgi:opacity protein-like surface antigen
MHAVMFFAVFGPRLVFKLGLDPALGTCRELAGEDRMMRSPCYGVHADIRAHRASGPRHVSSLALAFECWNYEWRTKIVPAFVALLGFGLSALADDVSVPALPTFAQSPQSNPQSPNPWSGLVVGSEVFVLSQKGAKGHVGGDGFIGYSHEFDDNLVIGVQAGAGYAPSLFACGPRNGFDFAMTNVSIGYDMGRFLPYVTAGAGLAKANSGPGGPPNAGDSFNDLFTGPSSPRALATVGAGADYAVTDHLERRMLN